MLSKTRMPEDLAGRLMLVCAGVFAIATATILAAHGFERIGGYAPCPLSNAHRTITFTFHTDKPGEYRWQCFVPCAAGWLYGFGGPMQTVGYMDGYLIVA